MCRETRIGELSYVSQIKISVPHFPLVPLRENGKDGTMERISSRSDRANLAVGFNPRKAVNSMFPSRSDGRTCTLTVNFDSSLRDAGSLFSIHRGLKPTAKFDCRSAAKKTISPFYPFHTVSSVSLSQGETGGTLETEIAEVFLFFLELLSEWQFVLDERN